MNMIRLPNKKEVFKLRYIILPFLLLFCVILFPGIVEASSGNELVFENDCWRMKNPNVFEGKLSSLQMKALKDACGSEEGFRAFLDDFSSKVCSIDKEYTYLNERGEARIVGGVCYGLSVSTILNKYGTVRLSSNLHSLDPKDYSSTIIFDHVAQRLPGVLYWREKYNREPIKSKLDQIFGYASFVKSGGCPVLILFGKKEYEDDSGKHEAVAHAVVGYAVEEYSAEKGKFRSTSTNKEYDHRILIYDCNNVSTFGTVKFDTEHCLLFNKKPNGNCTGEWEIPAYGVGSHNPHSFIESGNCWPNDLDPYAMRGTRFDGTIIYFSSDSVVCAKSSNWSVCGSGNGLTDNPNELVPLYTYSESSSGDNNSSSLALLTHYTDKSVTVSPAESSKDDVSVRVLMNGTYYNVGCDDVDKVELNNDGSYSISGNSGDFIIKSTVSSGDTFIVSGTSKNAGDIDVSFSGTELEISGDNVSGIEVNTVDSLGKTKKKSTVEKPSNGDQPNTKAGVKKSSDAGKLSNKTNAGKTSITEKKVLVKGGELITIPKAPSSVKVKAKKNKVTVSWKKIKKTKKNKKLLSRIKGIQIQYSTDPKFNQKSVTKIKKVGKNKTKVVLKIKKKKKKKKFYFRVRYIGKKGVSKWSRIRKIKTRL